MPNDERVDVLGVKLDAGILRKVDPAMPVDDLLSVIHTVGLVRHCAYTLGLHDPKTVGELIESVSLITKGLLSLCKEEE